MLILLYVLAGRSGLLEGVRAINFGAFFFPGKGRADGFGLLPSAAINLFIYAALAYLIASVVVRLFQKLKSLRKKC